MLTEPIEYLGILLCSILIGAAPIYYLIKIAFFDGEPPETPLNWPIFGWVIALACSYFVSASRQLSSRALIVYLGQIAAFYLVLDIKRRWIDQAAAVIGAIVSLAVLVEVGLTWSRPRLLSNPNITASFLTVIAFLEPWPAGIQPIMAVVATGCRGAMVGVLSALLVKYRIRLRYAAVIALVALVALVWLRPDTIAKRLHFWREAARLFLRRPLLGWGVGAYEFLPYDHGAKAHADSALLTVAAEMGAVGLLAWGWLVWSGAQIVARSDDPARLALVAWGVHQLADHTLMWAWVGLAVATSLAVVVKQEA